MTDEIADSANDQACEEHLACFQQKRGKLQAEKLCKCALAFKAHIGAVSQRATVAAFKRGYRAVPFKTLLLRRTCAAVDFEVIDP